MRERRTRPIPLPHPFAPNSSAARAFRAPLLPLASPARLLHGDESIDAGIADHLHRPGRPVNDDAFYALGGSQSKMRASIVLAGEAHAAVHHAPLQPPVVLDDDLGADGALVTPCRDEIERNPMVVRVRICPIE